MNIYGRIHDPKNRPQIPEIETAYMHHQKPGFLIILFLIILSSPERTMTLNTTVVTLVLLV